MKPPSYIHIAASHPLMEESSYDWWKVITGVAVHNQNNEIHSKKDTPPTRLTENQIALAVFITQDIIWLVFVSFIRRETHPSFIL